MPPALTPAKGKYYNRFKLPTHEPFFMNEGQFILLVLYQRQSTFIHLIDLTQPSLADAISSTYFQHYVGIK